MADNKHELSMNGSFGTGYVSVIMIFVVICLTVLAVLSFSAASSGASLDGRSRDNMAAYYEAEDKANRTLMEIDTAAYEAYESGLFMTFEDSLNNMDGVTFKAVPDGCKVGWNEPVTDKLTLYCEAVFYSEPSLHGGKRYDITSWDTAAAGSGAEVQINVWDGSMF